MRVSRYNKKKIIIKDKRQIHEFLVVFALPHFDVPTVLESFHIAFTVHFLLKYKIFAFL